MHTLKKLLVALALVAVALPLLSGTASAREPHQRVLELRDACDQVSWEGEFPGLCTKVAGSVSLPEFRAALADGGSGAWWIRQRDITLDAGDSIAATNVGGIVHTFTEVAAFGQGCITEWNQAVKETVNNCDFSQFDPVNGSLVLQGTTGEAKVLPVGVHRFQCLVHPWMRTVVTVRAD
jgi:plastocyanin